MDTAPILLKECIALLAFITMVKNVHSNSILYHDALYKMAQKVGIGDYRTFNKYLKICLELGLAIQLEQPYNTKGIRTIYKFISYSKAVNQLLGLNKREIQYFSLHKNITAYRSKFREHQKLIELDLAALNFRKQAYNAASNFPNKHNIISEINSLSKKSVSGRITRSERRRIGKLVKKLANVDSISKISTSKHHQETIVTGCKHAATLIGKCSTTANKRLKEWIGKGCLDVKNIVEFVEVGSMQEAFYVIDQVKHSRNGGVPVYLKHRQVVKVIYGKQILGFQSDKYSYGTLGKKSRVAAAELEKGKTILPMIQ